MIDPRIAAVLADIEYLCSELAQLGVYAPVPPRPSTRGRPKNTTALERQLESLYALRAWLGSQLTLARGEQVFAPGSGLDTLAARGIVAPPTPPRQPRRGRPRKAGGRQDELRWWTSLLQAHGAATGKARTTREAYQLAQRIVNARHGTGATQNESNVYRARRRATSR